MLSLYPQDVPTVAILMYVYSSYIPFQVWILTPSSSVFPGQTPQRQPLVAFTAQIPVNFPLASLSYVSRWHLASLLMVSHLPPSLAPPSLSDSVVSSRLSAMEVMIFITWEW